MALIGLIQRRLNMEAAAIDLGRSIEAMVFAVVSNTMMVRRDGEMIPTQSEKFAKALVAFEESKRLSTED